jgi:CHRD domain
MCMSKNLRLTICVGALLAPFLLGSAGADDHNNNNQYSATFSGFQEIGGLGAGETGAILSPAQGNLALNVANDNQSISFKLTYSGFTNNVTQSHIHFGKEHVAGGIMVFFCANPSTTPPVVNLPPPPATKPQTCPLTSGTVSGTLTPSDVVGPTGQAVKVGDFSALLAALKSNTAYGNIHTTAFPSGEIRGQILPSENDD